MAFKFHPLEDLDWPIRQRKDFNEMSTLEAMDSIIYAIEAEETDSAYATPRSSRKIRKYPHDDEGRVELILENFFNYINKGNTIQLKKFKKKLGKLFNACLIFIKSNNLKCNVYTKQNYCFNWNTNASNNTHAENAEWNRIHQQAPDYRMSVFISLGYHADEKEIEILDKKRNDLIKMITSNEMEVLNVSYIAL